MKSSYRFGSLANSISLKWQIQLLSLEEEGESIGIAERFCPGNRLKWLKLQIWTSKSYVPKRYDFENTEIHVYLNSVQQMVSGELAGECLQTGFERHGLSPLRGLWDVGIPRTKTLCKWPFSVVLDREWPGCPGSWVGTSRIWKNFYARKLWADFLFLNFKPSPHKTLWRFRDFLQFFCEICRFALCDFKTLWFFVHWAHALLGGYHYRQPKKYKRQFHDRKDRIQCAKT